jgi:hypothetical protein
MKLLIRINLKKDIKCVRKVTMCSSKVEEDTIGKEPENWIFHTLLYSQ